MKISFIAAMDKKGAIGLEGGLPWGKPIKSDMDWFKEKTLGKVVVMGRRTFDSLPKPLNKRTNVVITRDKDLVIPYDNVLTYHSVESVFRDFSNEKEVIVIGGNEIFKMFEQYMTKMYITHIDDMFDADTYFHMSWIRLKVEFIRKSCGSEGLCDFYTYYRK